MENLTKNPIILALVLGLFSAIISFLDHKFNSEEDFELDVGRYLKIFVLVALSIYAALTIYQTGNCSNSVQTPSSNVSQGSSAPWKEANRAMSVSEEIHTGNPNF